MSNLQDMIFLIEREVKPLMIQRDRQLEYSIKLQRLIEAFCRGDDPLPYPELFHSKKLTALRTHRSEVMNPPASAAQGAEAGNLNTEQRHRGFGLSLEGALPARPADEPPLSEWDEYEENGPMDLEDQLENALNQAFPK